MSKLGHFFCTIVKEQLLPQIDILVRVDTYPVVAVHEEDLDATVGFVGMIGKPNFATHPGCFVLKYFLKLANLGNPKS